MENGNAVFTADVLGSDFTLVQESTQSAAGTSDFSDVPASHAFYKEISWVSQKGVMNGTGSGRFTPGGNVNRQQMRMVLARMVGANPANMAEA